MDTDLEARVRRLEDIQEIEHLQKRYQFHFGMMEDIDKIMDCFSLSLM